MIVNPLARTRSAPVQITKAEPAMVTIAFDVSVLDPERLIAVTRHVMGLRGEEPQVTATRITGPEGTADIGECVRALMEESIAALGVSTGAVIGNIESYIEPIPEVDVA